MADERTTEQDEQSLNKEAKRVLQEARVIARWAKKPYYIS
jgi:hypothetical protein